jgi:hypothetical protein
MANKPDSLLALPTFFSGEWTIKVKKKSLRAALSLIDGHV